MIRKAKFNNFYSFQEEQEIDFLANKKKGYDYFQSRTGGQITKIAGFAGGNASGKTNIMRFFSFLSYFVCESSRGESSNSSNVAYKTFFNNKESSSFYIEFEDGDFVFTYNFTVKENIILKENLRAKKIQKGARGVEIFSRQLNNIKKLDDEHFKDFPVESLKIIRPDVSLIAFLKANYNIEIINNIHNYFAGFKTNINERGEINHLNHQFKTLVSYLEDDNLKKEMEYFICHFDVGLNNFIIKKEVKEKNVSISVQGVHSTKEKNNKLDFGYESRGTQSLFFTLANILSALKNNKIVIIDEIEAGFHPEALNKLIGYFIDENKDKKAQLIFSSHSLGFMNKLDMHQIYLVEKDDQSRSCAYRLNQVDGVRTDENFFAKYMSGAYGAFPKIRV